MTIELYGIPNCDTVKKARAWLAERGLAHAFHDYKKEGADPARLAAWARIAGWEALLNTRGTTFRKLAEGDRTGLDEARAIALMAAHPSLIKRPVVEYDGGGTGADSAAALLVGFDAVRWRAALDPCGRAEAAG